MRLVRGAAAAAVGIAVLAGCSDGGTANQTLPPTSTTAAETSESLPPLGPADLPMPDEAREQTAAGAEAFLRYYVDVMNHAQTSLVSTYVRDLSRQCATCDAFADGVDGYAEQGYRMSGGTIVVSSTSAPAITDDGAEFSVALTQQSLTVISQESGEVKSSAESAFPASGASMAWDDTRSTWLMVDLTIQ